MIYYSYKLFWHVHHCCMVVSSLLLGNSSLELWRVRLRFGHLDCRLTSFWVDGVKVYDPVFHCRLVPHVVQPQSRRIIVIQGEVAVHCLQIPGGTVGAWILRRVNTEVLLDCVDLHGVDIDVLFVCRGALVKAEIQLTAILSNWLEITAFFDQSSSVL